MRAEGRAEGRKSCSMYVKRRQKGREEGRRCNFPLQNILLEGSTGCCFWNWDRSHLPPTIAVWPVADTSLRPKGHVSWTRAMKSFHIQGKLSKWWTKVSGQKPPFKQCLWIRVWRTWTKVGNRLEWIWLQGWKKVIPVHEESGTS